MFVILKFLKKIVFDIIDDVNNLKEKLMPNSSSYSRFKFLKSMFRQAPLPESELDELQTLAEKYNPKMATYIKENRDILI